MVEFKKTIVGYFNEQVKDPHFDSQLPPPMKEDALRPSRPPKGVRTPSAGVSVPKPPVPDGLADAPGWTRRAGRLIAALEDAIATGGSDPTQIAAIERAWYAFEMGGVSDKEISKVAHVCERAHSALQRKMNGPINDAYLACAHVLHAGLPTKLRRQIQEEDVLEVVKEMRRTVDPWTAVVVATSQLLGWDVHWREHAAHAIRTALDAHPSSIR